jgi:hypothetical protein
MISVRFFPHFSVYYLLDVHFVQRVDEATDIVRKLCGEATFKGYETLQQVYIDQEKAVGGGVYHMTHV